MSGPKNLSILALTAFAVLTTSAALSEQPVLPPTLAPPPLQVPPARDVPRPHIPRVVLPAVEEEEAQPSDSALGRVSNVAPASGTALSPPVTITYSGSSNAVTINDSGAGRGLSSTVTNSNSTSSALYGETKGNSAGVKGVASSTGGIGGIFQVTDSASAQPGLSAATNGTGSAIVAQITKSSSYASAIVGTNTVTPSYGTGVTGNGNSVGVAGAGQTGVYGYSNATSGGFGVIGTSLSGDGVAGTTLSANGVYGESNTGTGVSGSSSSGDGVYGVSASSNGVYGISTDSYGIVAHSSNGGALYADSDHYFGIWGQSQNHYGVIGEDSGSGVGVYGYSASGYSGYFAGKVGAFSFVTVSDRNAKTAFAAVKGGEILERVSELPITSWTFKGDASHRHLGPMAQDFHAAFGLNGNDDTHINLSDAAGVSLAAIQELNKRLKQKDRQIAELEARVTAMKATNAEFAVRMAKLEQRIASPGTQPASLPMTPAEVKD